MNQTIPAVTIIGNASGMIPSPLVDPISWNTIEVQGTRIGPGDGSGKVVVKRVRRPYKWQKKDAAGQDGETKTFRGKKPPDFEIEFHLWVDEHFTAFQTMANASFLYDSTKTNPDPVDVYHPAFAIVGISQMIVDECGAPEQQGDTHLWIATVKVCEYFPPVATNVTATPTGALPYVLQTDGSQPVPADISAAQAEIATQQHINDSDSTYP